MAEAEILPSGEFGVAVLAQEETTTEEQGAIAGTETTHKDEDNSNNNDQGAATVNLSNDSMDPPAPNLTKESPPRTSPTKQQHRCACRVRVQVLPFFNWLAEQHKAPLCSF